MIAEVERFEQYSAEKLTKEILKVREEIYSILNKLSADESINSSSYAILCTSKENCFSFAKNFSLSFCSTKISASDDFTEDIYFMHQELLQELESQYETNKSIYEQIENWNEVFLEFQEFEVRPKSERRNESNRFVELSEKRQ